MTGTCEMCLRDGVKLTRHHMIPRTTHKRKRTRKQHSREDMRGRILMICGGCHNQIHVLLTERELADEYNTVDQLFAHPDIAKYIAWIRGRKVRGRVSVRRKRRLSTRLEQGRKNGSPSGNTGRTPNGNL